MIKLLLLAFGFTIDDKTLGFLFFSFQLFTPKIHQFLAFSSWLLATFPALAFFSSKIK